MQLLYIIMVSSNPWSCSLDYVTHPQGSRWWWTRSSLIWIYINNIMIFTKMNDLKKHNEIMLEVLCCLEENDLYVKPEKCTFHTTEVNFLGIIVGKNGIKIDKEKVKAILGLASTIEHKRNKKFPWISKFLLKIHSELHTSHKTSEWPLKERCHLQMERSTATCIWYTQGKIYNSSCFSLPQQ